LKEASEVRGRYGQSFAFFNKGRVTGKTAKRRGLYEATIYRPKRSDTGPTDPQEVTAIQKKKGHVGESGTRVQDMTRNAVIGEIWSDGASKRSFHKRNSEVSPQELGAKKPGKGKKVAGAC